MKIISLVAENVKRLTAVTITPDGNLVQITGRNGQGKTSVLDSIWWALEGAANIQAEPIRKGQKEARIRLDLGEYVVTRHFTRKEDGGFTTSIAVESADGARFPSPQKMLDKLLGSLTFDPLAFARAKPVEQFNELRQFVPGVDFEAIENANRGDYQKRTEVNRRAKEARTLADGIEVPPEADAKPIDTAGVLDKLQTAHGHNSEIDQRKAAREAATEKAAECRRQADLAADRALDFERQAEAARNEQSRQLVQAVDLEKRLAEAGPLPEYINVEALASQVREAQTRNSAIEAAQRRRLEKAQHVKAADELEAQSAALTDAMQKRTADKDAAIAGAKMPVPGIGFGDGFVTLNGVPFEQGSDAEQLRASVAIAMAANPKLRVIRVRDGSLLDADGMKLLAEMADKHDCQVWVESVDSSASVGFVIEDGHLKAQAEQAA